MIVAERKEHPPEIFEKVLADSKKLMLSKSQSLPDYFVDKDDAGFEVDVFDNMNLAAKGTPFNNNIELISGHSFPDIITKNSFFGVEVKKTNKNHWTSTGNSVLESTRVKDVKTIYIFFGKLISPVDFKIRLYQDCLNDIAVTHSPRYRIDMDLATGKTLGLYLVKMLGEHQLGGKVEIDRTEGTRILCKFNSKYGRQSDDRRNNSDRRR